MHFRVATGCASVPSVQTGGWFDPSREAGFIRREANSYLADPSDAYVGPHLVKQYGLLETLERRATPDDVRRSRMTLALLRFAAAGEVPLPAPASAELVEWQPILPQLC